MPWVYVSTLYVARACPHYHFPAMATLEVLVYFSGSDSTVNIMRRYCRIQPLQIHHSHLRRPVPSIQSARHHPLMHAAPDNRQLQTRSEESDEAHLICSVPLELLLRYGHLSFFLKELLWLMRHGESSLHLLRWERRPYPSNSKRAQRTIPLLSICHANTTQTVAL